MIGLWNAGIGSIFCQFLCLPYTLDALARQDASHKRVEHQLNENMPKKAEAVAKEICFRVSKRKRNCFSDHLFSPECSRSYPTNFSAARFRARIPGCSRIADKIEHTCVQQSAR